MTRVGFYEPQQGLFTSCEGNVYPFISITYTVPDIVAEAVRFKEGTLSMQDFYTLLLEWKYER